MITFKQFRFLNESLSSAKKFFFDKYYEEQKENRNIEDGSGEDQALYERTVEWFEKLVACDPTPQKKYLDWIVRHFSGIFSEFETIIKDFDKISNHPGLKKRDINAYESLGELQKEVDRVEFVIMSKPGKGSYGIAGLKEGEDYRVVYRDDNWTIFQPLNFSASRKIGSNTEWCTVAAEYRWEQYTEDSNLYYCIGNDGEKFAVRSLYDGVVEVYDRRDKVVENVYFFTNIMKMNSTQVTNIFKKPDLVESFIKKYNLIKDTNSDGYITTESMNLRESEYLFNDRVPVNIVRTEGDFDLHGISIIKTLENCPKFVGGEFNCSGTSITSLIGAPVEASSFKCAGTQITSLEHGPKKVRHKYYAYDTMITNLIGMPEGPIKNVDVSMCDNFESLVGCPKIVTQHFSCSYCNLRSFEGCPDEVNSFEANNNPLETLEFLPKKVRSLKLYHCFDHFHEDTYLFDELEQVWEKHFEKIGINGNIRSFQDVYDNFVKTNRDLDKNLDMKKTIIQLINDKYGHNNTVIAL